MTLSVQIDEDREQSSLSSAVPTHIGAYGLVGQVAGAIIRLYERSPHPSPLEIARVATDAMQEPSEAMLEAACRNRVLLRGPAKEIYQDMILAARAEGLK